MKKPVTAANSIKTNWRHTPVTNDFYSGVWSKETGLKHLPQNNAKPEIILVLLNRTQGRFVAASRLPVAPVGPGVRA
jgi:hypothetical protein